MREASARLARGAHHDPHGILGPHRDGASLVIRAWQPGAEGVTLVVEGGREVAMRPVGDDGLFAVRLRRTTAPRYRFRVTHAGGSFEAGDPYRFGPTIGELDLHLIGEGTHRRLWDALGARPAEVDGVAGVAFTVWAPSARGVAVTGDFNGWDERRHPLRTMGASGVWEAFVPDAHVGDRYKLAVHGADGVVTLRADPLAREAEAPSSATCGRTPPGWRSAAPGTASTGRWRSTRCTWDRGAAASTTARWPRSCRRTSRSSGSRTSS
jgi:1,4-alpha-glucan branching enzyme